MPDDIVNILCQIILWYIIRTHLYDEEKYTTRSGRKPVNVSTYISLTEHVLGVQVFFFDLCSVSCVRFLVHDIFR